MSQNSKAKIYWSFPSYATLALTRPFGQPGSLIGDDQIYNVAVTAHDNGLF